VKGERGIEVTCARKPGPQMMPNSLARPKLAVMVARQIVHEITARRLGPGTKLPSEAEMLADYGVSRNTLREALRLLEVNGLLWIKPGPGGGAVVGSVESENLGHTLSLYLHMNGSTFRELMEARALLEPALVRQAALRSDPQLLERLEEAVKMADAIELSDDREWFAASNLFHTVIAGSGNSVLDLFSGALGNIYRERIRGTLIMGKEGRDKTRTDHANIAEAVRLGDAERAGDLMAKHMAEVFALVRSVMPNVFDEVIDWR
jgi:GntR family transcriptional regulator, transcriptional repressor for pyruvate dehydrogenase complex